MPDFITYHCIGNSVSARASLISSLARQLAEQDKRDLLASEQLLQKAPEALREWLSKDMILTNLFMYGRCDTKINFHGEYGFGDFANVQHKLRQLRKRWKDVVVIKIGVPERHRVQVWISAIL